jgi:hypothetical protein
LRFLLQSKNSLAHSMGDGEGEGHPNDYCASPSTGDVALF